MFPKHFYLNLLFSFINTLQEVYSQKKVTAGDVGLSMEDFADSVGIKRQNIHKKLIALTYPCMYRGEIREFKVFAKVKVGKHTFLKLNPFILEEGRRPTSRDLY
ncbi:hypothetical protein AB9M93_25405 [Peribacillus frigoritolerans]|uniref:hypothetical protein n=1 Tax=Peribacillus frigoritolerans TaxID=450367 RepID=UPI0035170FA6